MSIVDALLEATLPWCETAVISDVRLGLGYTAVQVNREAVGIAWSPKSTGHACTVFSKAGTLQGRKASEVLPWLQDADNPWMRVIGLAALNAVLHLGQSPALETTDIISALALTPQDRVAMVGCFQPLLPAIRARGAHLDIIELDPEDDDTLSPEEGRQALRTCTVAILTATSLVTGTLDALLADLATAPTKPRAAVLLGPSTPLIPLAFRGTPITHLAGSWVRNTIKALQIVSEGGGTPQLKPHLAAVTLSTMDAISSQQSR